MISRILAVVLVLMPLSAFAQSPPQPDIKFYANKLLQKNMILTDEATTAETQVQMLMDEVAKDEAQIKDLTAKCGDACTPK